MTTKQVTTGASGNWLLPASGWSGRQRVASPTAVL